MRKFFGIFFIVIAICLASSGGYLLYQKFEGYKENEEIYDKVADIAINDTYTLPDENVPLGNAPGMDLNQYKEKNENNKEGKKEKTDKKKEKKTTINWEELNGLKNLRGWVMFGDVVNYPIMQYGDNQYYLTHAYNGTYNANGSVFMNSENDGFFRDANTIIYGHNLRSGRMFGTFKQYLQKNGKDLHFYIYTPDGKKRTYEIISIAETKDGGFAYNYAFSKIEKYKEYLEKVTGSSQYNTGYKYDISKKTVTLSTCRSTGSAAGWRVVIVGQESNVEDVQKPASWYKAPADKHVTVLDIENEFDKTTNEINDLKRQRKEEEMKQQNQAALNQ